MKPKYQDLVNAYSEENLTQLTTQIIQLYKSGNKSVLMQLARIMSDFVKIEDGNLAKIFAQIIILIHPDRAKLIQSKIKTIIDNEKHTALRAYLFILELDDFDEIVEKFSTGEELEIEEETVWEKDDDSYAYFNDEEEYSFDFEEADEFDFYHAVKKKIYGNKDVNFPPHYLEDYEEIEMSSSGITDLSGIEYCKYVKKLFLNQNEITDITNLMNLEFMEELYLSRNNIGFIDSLESLENLRIIDFSFNQIDDISPILELPKLEFINLLENDIPKSQIDSLKENDVLVLY